MPDSAIDSNLPDLEGAMRRLSGASLQKFKGRVTYYVAVALKGIIKAYPGPANSPVKWPSEKARRYYFWMRKEAGLSMQYKRDNDVMSQRLSQSWTIARGQESATVGSRATYAPYVASSEYQTEQHKATGFTTDAQAADQVIESGVMDRIIQAQIKVLVRDAFRGMG